MSTFGGVKHQLIPIRYLSRFDTAIMISKCGRFIGSHLPRRAFGPILRGFCTIQHSRRELFKIASCHFSESQHSTTTARESGSVGHIFMPIEYNMEVKVRDEINISSNDLVSCGNYRSFALMREIALIPAKKKKHLGSYVAGLVFPDNHTTNKAQDEAPIYQ